MLRSCATIAASLVSAGAYAALISGTANSSPSNTANLSQLADTAWAYWNTTGTGLTSAAPTNVMSGTSIIGSATPVGGTTVRGSGTLTATEVAFTDGASPVSGSAMAVSGIFNSSLDLVGRGVQVAVTLPDTQPYTIYLWVSGRMGRGALTASFDAATRYTDSSFVFVDSPKPTRLYTLSAQADTPGQQLNLSYVLNSDTGTSAHVLISAIAISTVPEPAAIGILGAAAFLTLARRRAS